MRKIINFLRFSLGASWLMLWSAILVVVLVLLLPFRALRIKVCNIYGSIVSPFILWMARAKVIFHNRDRVARYRPAIYVSNHSSTSDIFIGMWVCPVGGCSVAKKEIARVPIYGQAFQLSGHMLIDRNDRESAIAGLKDVADTVKRHGLSIWLWPEGTRSKDGRLLPLKKGVAHLALATGLDIVPIMVHGAHKNWPKDSAWGFHEQQIDVHVLEPVFTKDWKAETIDQHLADLQDVMAAALPEDQRPLPATAQLAAR